MKTKTILFTSMLIATGSFGLASAQTMQPIRTPPPGARQPAVTSGVTEAQARMAIAEKGYINVSTLKKVDNGNWIGNAMKSGKTVNLKVTPDGQVASR